MNDDFENNENNGENQYKTPTKTQKGKGLRSPLGEIDVNAEISKSPLSSKSMFSPKKYQSVGDEFGGDDVFKNAVTESMFEFQSIKNFIFELKLYSKNTESLDNLCNDVSESSQSLVSLMDREYDSIKQNREDHEVKQDLMNTFKLSCQMFRTRLQEIITKAKRLDDNQPNIAAIEYVEIRLHQLPEHHLSHFFENGIHFSQLQATNYFKSTTTTQTSSPQILGKKVDDVGRYLTEHPEDIEQLKIGFFIYKNQMVAENNRALSALTISRIPLNHPQLRLVGIAPSQLILNAYLKKLGTKLNPYQIDLVGDNKRITARVISREQKSVELTPTKGKKPR